MVEGTYVSASIDKVATSQTSNTAQAALSQAPV